MYLMITRRRPNRRKQVLRFHTGNDVVSCNPLNRAAKAPFSEQHETSASLSIPSPSQRQRQSGARRCIHSISRIWFMCLTGLLLFAMENARAAEHDHILWTIRWNQDGSLFAVGGVRALWVFDSDTFEGKSLLPDTQGLFSNEDDNPYWAVTRVAWNPSSNLLAVSSQGKNVNGIYDIFFGNRTALTAHQNHFGRGVSWSPDGSRLALTSDDELMISKADGTVLHSIPRYKEAKGLSGVSWSPAGDRIVTIGARITLHDAQGEPIKQIMHRSEAQERDQLLLSVAWHPSGEFFVVGDYGTEVDDPVLQFWSVDGELLKSTRLKGDTQVRDVSWSPDGSRLASASSKLRLWTKEGELLHETESPDLLWGVDWHPKGDKILTSSIEGRVTLWTPTGEIVKEVVVPPDLQAGQTSR